MGAPVELYVLPDWNQVFEYSNRYSIFNFGIRILWVFCTPDLLQQRMFKLQFTSKEKAKCWRSQLWGRTLNWMMTRAVWQLWGVYMGCNLPGPASHNLRCQLRGCPLLCTAAFIWDALAWEQAFLIDQMQACHIKTTRSPGNSMFTKLHDKVQSQYLDLHTARRLHLQVGA